MAFQINSEYLPKVC